MLKLQALAKEWQLAFFIFIPSLFHLDAGAALTLSTNHLRNYKTLSPQSSLRGRTCREELTRFTVGDSTYMFNTLHSVFWTWPQLEMESPTRAETCSLESTLHIWSSTYFPALLFHACKQDYQLPTCSP